MSSFNPPNNSKGYARITSLAASTALTVPAGSRAALIIPEGQAVRWRDDGVAPTAAIGMPLYVGQGFRFTGNLSNIRFIEQVAGATLHIYFYS